MIWEIELEQQANLSKYIGRLKKLGRFAVSNRIIYLDTFQDISIISQELPIVKCSQITSSNYKKIESSFGRKWCSDILYAQELTQFEKTEACQERLKFINQQLDILEKEG